MTTREPEFEVVKMSDCENYTDPVGDRVRATFVVRTMLGVCVACEGKRVKRKLLSSWGGTVAEVLCECADCKVAWTVANDGVVHVNSANDRMVKAWKKEHSRAAAYLAKKAEVAP